MSDPTDVVIAGAGPAGAIAALSLSEGRLLEQYGVTVEVEGDPGLPWWAKF